MSDYFPLMEFRDLPANEHSYLGDGGVGVVHRVRGGIKTTGKYEIYARKTIDSTRGDPERVCKAARQEYEHLQNLCHRNIVRVFGFEQTTLNVNIFMEYCPGGNLDYFIETQMKKSNPVSRGYALSVFYQICAAVHYCHTGTHWTWSYTKKTKGIGRKRIWYTLPNPDPPSWTTVLHRDIKPGNVLLSTIDPDKPVHVKLSDFGHATLFNNENPPATTARGTSEYKAPEIRSESYSSTSWTVKCDVFSIGATVYELMQLHPAFTQQRTGPERIPSADRTVYKALSSRMDSCMSFEPERRPSTYSLLRKVLMGFEVWHNTIHQSLKPKTKEDIIYDNILMHYDTILDREWRY